MISNYLKVALRYLLRHKSYTIINVTGLAVGITCCILISLFVKSEWSFDRFHNNAGRMYRAWLEEHVEGQVFRNTVTPIPLGPVLQLNVPGVEAICRVSGGESTVTINNTSFDDPVSIVDSNFFSLFDFKLIAGSAKTVLQTPNSVVLSQDAARKYFGTENAVGKNLQIKVGDETLPFTVAGVAKNPPLESSIQYGLLIPFANAPYIWSEKTRTQGWSNVSVETIVLLKQGVDPAAANKAIAAVMNPIVAKSYKAGDYLVRLQPLPDMHFNATLPDNMDKPSDPKYAYILATIGLLILAIACINFVTLSIGRSVTRALEVGVRKVLGAGQEQLIGQFWGEGLLLTLVALLIGCGGAWLLQKPFSQLANRTIEMHFDLYFVWLCAALTAIIALFAGSYPALVLSRFKPIEVLKGKLQASNIGLFRKLLVTIQFTVSIAMIIGTFSIGRQLHYLQSRNLGYDKEHIVVVPTNNNRREGLPLASRFGIELDKNSAVVNHATALYSLAEDGWMNLGYNDSKNNFRQFRFNAIDADFVQTMGLKLVAGRDFVKGDAGDSNYILVNEALVREYGWKDPIGKQLPGQYPERVIGVVKDFNFESLHASIKPAVLALRADGFFKNSSDVSYNTSPEPRVSIRLQPGDLTSQIASLRAAWKSVAGNQEFEFYFLDESLRAAYTQEQRLGAIARYASLLSIFIASLGLFGLATLAVVRRTKEIGIRKVLGADAGNIIALLSKDFLLLVTISAVAAFPIAWWALHRWLQDFVYRTPLQTWVFLGAAGLALVIAFATISIQALRAARANPVKSLRTE